MNQGIQIFKTHLSPCSYILDLMSSNHVIDPDFKMTPHIYDFLLDKGFRRSGDMVYRPACPDCDQCKSTRVPVKNFFPNKNQRRAWNKVKDSISYSIQDPIYTEEHYNLYTKYAKARHSDSEMANSDKKQYIQFLSSNWSDTLFIEIKLADELLAVAVTDQQPNSLSALYTFFDPEKSSLSPGVISILSQIQITKDLGLKWLYLGYWIKDSPKMLYKTKYRPIQVLNSGQWELFNT